MGEAKRRKQRLGQPINYTDMETGTIKQARNAGDPEKFLARLRAMGDAQDTLGLAATVPCQGCVSCCYFEKVDFDPEKERAEDLAHLDYTMAEDGMAVLNKREDGGCIHLGEQGCTVYAHRPRPCRLYDYRVAGLVCMVDNYDDVHFSPGWMFEPQTRRGRIIMEGMRLLSLMHIGQCEREGRSTNVGETFQRVMGLIDKWCEAMESLSRMSSDQLADALGVDPRTISEEDSRQALLSLARGGTVRTK
jgi:Putative zinc- or iron-chelating domain